MPAIAPSFVRRIACATLLVFAASPAFAAPTVADDSYSVNVNTSLVVNAASGVLANDTGFSAATHRLESSDSYTRYGGRVSVAADGSFTYQPALAFRGNDSFSYTVRDATGASTAVVRIDVSGESVWFVDDSAPAGGDGSRSAPFNSFAPLNGAGGAGDVDAPGETIFVFAGNYAVAFTLEPGQKLIGEAAGLDLVGTANDVPAGATPALSSASAAPVISFSGANSQIRAFAISNSTGKALLGTGISGTTLQDIAITSGAGSSGAVEINGNSGTSTLNNVDITGSVPATDSAFAFLSNSGTLNLVGSTVSSFTGGRVLTIDGNSGTIGFDANSDLSSSNTAGLAVLNQSGTGSTTLAGVTLSVGVSPLPLVFLVNPSGTTVRFSEGLSAQASAVDSDALYAQSGRLQIDGTSSVLTASDGQALHLETVQLLANATFASLSSTDSDGRGIFVSEPVGTFDVVVTGTSTISNSAQEAIRLFAPAASGFALQLARLNSTGRGIFVQNAALDVSDAASTLDVTAGIGVNCQNGTTNLFFATLNASGGTRALSFDSCSGTVNAAAGTLTSTAGVSNHVVHIASSTLGLSFGGTINKTTQGRGVNIDGLTGTGSVFFSTTTATAASNGIAIQNSARPVTFATLNLGTNAARYTSTPVLLEGNTGAVDLGVVSIFASGTTGLDISQANASPGLVSSSPGSLIDLSGAGVALFVDHATAQPLNLRFTSITSTGAGTHGIDVNRGSGTLQVSTLTNLGAKTVAGIEISNSSLAASFQEVDIAGAADGVRLIANTGSFTISGDGSTSSHTNGAGGTFSSLTDNALDIAGAVNVQVQDLTITTTGSHAVTGTGLTGNTTFSNVDMTGIGNANDEHVYNFQDGATSGSQVSGTLRIQDSVINGFTDNGVFIENFSGALNFYFMNNTLQNNITTTACGGGNCDGNGILLRADGTATITARIESNFFTQIDGIGISANPEGNSAARMDLTIRSNTLNANAYAGPSHTNNGEIAISVRNQQGNSRLLFDIDSNSINNYSGELALAVVEVEAGDFANTDGTIRNNTINHAHLGNVIGLFADGANTAGPATTSFLMNVRVNDNNVPAGAPVFGATLLSNNNGTIAGSTVSTNLIAQNNTFGAVATGASRRTLTVNLRDFNNACTHITGNNLAAGTGGTQPSINLSYNGTGQMRLQGMAGTGDANAIAYLGANNTLAVAAASGPNNNITSATCTAPTLPNTLP